MTTLSSIEAMHLSFAVHDLHVCAYRVTNCNVLIHVDTGYIETLQHFLN